LGLGQGFLELGRELVETHSWFLERRWGLDRPFQV
jgi:hypothetical protein